MYTEVRAHADGTVVRAPDPFKEALVLDAANLGSNLWCFAACLSLSLLPFFLSAYCGKDKPLVP